MFQSLKNAFSRLLNRTATPKPYQYPTYSGGETGERHYAATKLDDTTYNWNISSGDPNDPLTYLRLLRERSRQGIRDDAYLKKALLAFDMNVIGKKGILFQSLAENEADKAVIEKSFKQWCEQGNCEVTGKLSFRQVQSQALTSWKRDGEFFIRLVQFGAGRDFPFQMQCLESDYCPVDYTDLSQRIKMGIKFDEWGKPVSYFFYQQNPAKTVAYINDADLVEIPADQIIHIMDVGRSGQVRGETAFHAALVKAYHLNQYTEAEIVAARLQAAASKAYFQTMDSGSYQGEVTDNGVSMVNLAPNEAEVLPMGWDVKLLQPTHPNGNFAGFSSAILHGLASSLGLCYHTVSGDLSQVSYSSARIAMLDERRLFETIQMNLIDTFLSVVFKKWIKSMIASGKLPSLRLSQLDAYTPHKWIPPSWDWIDPVRDVTASLKQINGGLKAWSDVVTEMGQDPEELAVALEKDQVRLGTKLKGILWSLIPVLQSMDASQKKPPQ